MVFLLAILEKKKIILTNIGIMIMLNSKTISFPSLPSFQNWYVAQVDLELLGSSNLPYLTSQLDLQACAITPGQNGF